MLTRIASHLVGRLFAALLVLTIAAHAAAPIEAPLARSSGSAFAATTVETAVSPVRRAEVRLVAPQPVPIPLTRPIEIAGETLRLAADPAIVPPATGPPLPAPLARRQAPRGPPRA